MDINPPKLVICYLIDLKSFDPVGVSLCFATYNSLMTMSGTHTVSRGSEILSAPHSAGSQCKPSICQVYKKHFVIPSPQMLKC